MKQFCTLATNKLPSERELFGGFLYGIRFASFNVRNGQDKKRILFPCSFFLPYPSSFLSFFHFFLPVAPQGKHQQRQRWPHREREREKDRKKAGLSPSRAGRRAFYIRLLLLLLQTFDITQDRKEKGKREGGFFLFRPLFFTSWCY